MPFAHKSTHDNRVQPDNRSGIGSSFLPNTFIGGSDHGAHVHVHDQDNMDQGCDDLNWMDTLFRSMPNGSGSRQSVASFHSFTSPGSFTSSSLHHSQSSCAISKLLDSSSSSFQNAKGEHEEDTKPNAQTPPPCPPNSSVRRRTQHPSYPVTTSHIGGNSSNHSSTGNLSYSCMSSMDLYGCGGDTISDIEVALESALEIFHDGSPSPLTTGASDSASTAHRICHDWMADVNHNTFDHFDHPMEAPPARAHMSNVHAHAHSQDHGHVHGDGQEEHYHPVGHAHDGQINRPLYHHQALLPEVTPPIQRPTVLGRNGSVTNDSTSAYAQQHFLPHQTPLLAHSRPSSLEHNKARSFIALYHEPRQHHQADYQPAILDVSGTAPAAAAGSLIYQHAQLQADAMDPRHAAVELPGALLSAEAVSHGIIVPDAPVAHPIAAYTDAAALAPLAGAGVGYVDYYSSMSDIAVSPHTGITMGHDRIPSGGPHCPFPQQLHDMLAQNRFPTIVSWAPHGRAFVVRRTKEFETEVLPHYFKQTKYKSFQRQLNLYGFHRITHNEADRGGYHHALFLRGRRKLSTRIRRQGTKRYQQQQHQEQHQALHQAVANAAVGHGVPLGQYLSATFRAEPNFYSMEPILADAAATTSNTIRSSNIADKMDHIPLQVPALQHCLTGTGSVQQQRPHQGHRHASPSPTAFEPRKQHQQQQQQQHLLQRQQQQHQPQVQQDFDIQ